MTNKEFQIIINNIKEQKLNVESLIITQDEKTYEYFFKPERLTDLRSISKAITGLALGIAFSKGFFKDGVDTYIFPYFKDKKITNIENLENLKKLQIKHLITYTAGYDKQVLNKVFLSTLKEKNNNFIEIALNYPLKYKPGEKFVFSNAPIYLLSVMLEKETKMKLSDFVKENILDKLDIKDFEWKDNEENHTWGATGLKIFPKDLHKISQLLLNNGRYNNKQIVPYKWLEEMKVLRNISINDYVSNRVIPKYGHGYTLWLCNNDIYYHDAKGGQYIICVPNKNMVITITADDEVHRHDVLETLRKTIY